MRIPRIYTPGPLTEAASVVLDASPSQHLAKALRKQVGDPVVIFDGRGSEYSATITSVDKRAVTLQVGSTRLSDVESPLTTELAIAISRGERMDWVVQKATELGVSKITPLITERVEVKLPADRAAKRIAHWQQVAVSACEQSGRTRLPEIATITPLRTWLEATSSERRFVLHHRAGTTDAFAGPTPASVKLLIGPEGGLTADEISAAQSYQFEALQLGPRVLRTETAPLAALTLFQARWGDIAG